MAEVEQVEVAEPLGDGFDEPKIIPDITYAFPAQVVGELLPEWEKIPEDFQRQWSDGNEWSTFINRVFMSGWPKDLQLYQRDDIDGELAWRHIHTVLKSFEPKHEHKIAGASWLLSRWFAAVRPV